jgi:hypothetical protein
VNRASERRGRPLPRLSLLVLVTVLAACAGGDHEAPTTLMDGAPPDEVPIELEGVEEPAVLTRVGAMTLDEIVPGSAAHSCVTLFEDQVDAAAPVVRRVGVHTESLTFRDAPGRWVLGCDDSTGPHEEGQRWCGTAAGRLYAGRLRDPRVDIGCSTAGGEQVGFAWIHPDAGTRYVVVLQPGYAETYEVAASVPVRIATTSGVDIERSRARFDVREHDGEGALIRRYEIAAGVAG